MSQPNPDTVKQSDMNEDTIQQAIDEVEGLEEALQSIASDAAGGERNQEDYEREIAELKDRLLRAVAETENIRKRSQRELQEANKYAVTGFARDLISVVENLNRAASSIPVEAQEASSELKNIAQGVDMTLRETYSVFERHHIKRIDPKGDMFDPNLHQAVVQIESDDAPAGTILQVMQAGYTIHDRLLQPAMVGVAKASAGAITSSGSEHIDTEA
jgi:molecular chaperone GrpE